MIKGKVKGYVDENDQFVIVDDNSKEWTAKFDCFIQDNPHMTLVIRDGMKVSFETDADSTHVTEVRAIA